jgi:radical SAM superfamily enzyme YgiQ (UPF0313 family)
MRLALVQPGTVSDTDSVPLGLSYLAAYVLRENDDVEVRVLDTGVATPEEKERFLSDRYDVIGITSTSRTHREAIELAGALRRGNPDSPTIFGGAHVAALKQEVMEEPLIDLAAYGEGELTLNELLGVSRQYRKSEWNADILSKIDGIIFRNGSDAVVNRPRDLIEDLDSLPFPAYHLFPVTRYPGKLSILSSRGCPFGCAFCATATIWGRNWRPRSAENVVAEVEHLIKTHGPIPFDFQDDTFNLDIDRVHAICDLLISRKIRVPWAIRGFRADRVDLALAKKMRKAGCGRLAIGVESAHPEVLKQMRKGETIEKIDRGIRVLSEAGIHVTGQFMIGNPGETLETVKESIDYVRRSPLLHAGFGTAIPFPGTALWSYVQEHGRFLVEPDCTLFHELEPRLVFDTPEFPEEERLEAVRLATEAGLMIAKDRNPGRSAKRKAAILYRLLPRVLPRSVSFKLHFWLRDLKTRATTQVVASKKY